MLLLLLLQLPLLMLQFVATGVMQVQPPLWQPMHRSSSADPSSMEHAASGGRRRGASCPPRLQQPRAHQGAAGSAGCGRERSGWPAAAAAAAAATAGAAATQCPWCWRPCAQRRVAGSQGPEFGCCYLCVQRRGATKEHTRTCRQRTQRFVYEFVRAA